ncbi:MAG: cytochrome c oxidase subunit 3 [Alphaproteobacteria bacterium]|nr:cytochrome c oxidase subunit 3 [Alphaproteobacteria bacterium]
MFFFRQIVQKPWVTVEESISDLHGGAEFSLPAAKVGLWVFCAVITSLFLLFIASYSMRMSLADWRPLPEPGLLWLNTAILILSSVALQWARVNARRERIDQVKIGLFWGGGFAIAFLAGQLLVWQQLVALGFFSAANPANAFFYLFTGVHGLHLFGGLVALGRTTAKVRRDGFDMARVRLSVELCTAYWHFLLAVWLVLFGLLLLT